MVDFDDFDLGPQSDEYSEHDDSFADEMELGPEDSLGYDDMYGDAEMSRWDDDPSPYDGTYSEE